VDSTNSDLSLDELNDDELSEIVHDVREQLQWLKSCATQIFCCTWRQAVAVRN